MTPIDLAACPFCGATDCALAQTLEGLHIGLCRTCEAQGPPKATIGEALLAWNDRILPQSGDTILN